MLFEHLHRLSNQHEFHVFTYADANHDFADIRPYVKTHRVTSFRPGMLFKSPFGRLNQLIRFIDLKRMVQLEKKMAHAIEQEGFDLLWANPSQIQNAPSIVANIKKIPTVFYCQEPLRILYEQMPARPYDHVESRFRTAANKVDPFYNLFFKSLKDNDRRNILSSNHILVNSNFMRSIVSEIYGVQPVTNYGGVDLDFFQSLSLPREDYLFSVGSLTPLKGFDFLIRAIASLPESRRLPLIIASNFANPLEKKYLQRLAGQKNVKLKLETGISDEELRRHYNRTRLTVCAAHREPFGLVPVESMACGTPVIAVAEGGFKESIADQITGVLTSRDEKAFGAAIAELLDNKDKWARLSSQGIKSVQEKWSWQHSADRLGTLLQSFTTTI